ncbi:MAG: quinone oxidoreductase, partial [Burkholderiales bacterium]
SEPTPPAATMLKGFTAGYLAEDIVPLSAGQSALVHSAAGGVGSLLVPWLRDKGVRVIAHVGSQAKEAQVNAEHVLSCPFDELAKAVRDLTGGTGVDIALDGVGQASWKASVRSMRPRGMLVSYGNASGAVPPISLLELMRAGSIAVTRPTLADFMATPEAAENMAHRLFSRIESGVIPVTSPQRYSLVDAAEAHRALEARQTTGSTVLIP